MTVIAPENKGGVGSLLLTTDAATATKETGTRAKTAVLWDAADAQMRIEIQGKTRARAALTATTIDDAGARVAACRYVKEAWGIRVGARILQLTTFAASASKLTNATTETAAF